MWMMWHVIVETNSYSFINLFLIKVIIENKCHRECLCESLTYGCLPISLADFNKVDDGHSWSPIVYPFEKRTFSWVNENKKTREVIVEFNLLKENIEFLRNRN